MKKEGKEGLFFFEHAVDSGLAYTQLFSDKLNVVVVFF
jgi:hypothetical protein